MSIFFEIIKELRFNIGFRKRLMSAQKKLNAGTPRVGDLAPDFTLSDLSGKESVTLSAFRGKKPVALVFGSFT